MRVTDYTNIKYSEKEILAKYSRIKQIVLDKSRFIYSENFDKDDFIEEDVDIITDAINELFLNNSLTTMIVPKLENGIRNNAGSMTYESGIEAYRLRISTELLFRNEFNEEHTRLDELISTITHEIVHALEHEMGRKMSHDSVFKQMVHDIFGQNTIYHYMVNFHKSIKQKYGIAINKKFYMKYEHDGEIKMIGGRISGIGKKEMTVISESNKTVYGVPYEFLKRNKYSVR